jgi:hypothetical protein
LVGVGTARGIFEVMRDLELEEDCPGLVDSAYEITSPRDPQYNCVAFAVGDTSHFWYDVEVSGYYWPPGAPSADTLDGWVKVFATHGYVKCDHDGLESEFEKVAIYATSEAPEHVARQKASGVWTSKMGKGHDIEHASLEVVEGATMGKVVMIMKRRCKDGKRVLE